MLKRNQRALAILLAIALIFACAPIATPIAAPPTFDLLSIDTVIAQTAGAAATQTFVLLPTLTITPTFTRVPTETPSPTPTFIFILPTSTVPSSTPTLGQSKDPYACSILSQSPVNNASFVPGINFQARWQIGNIGTQTWDTNAADVRYSSGDKLHKTAIYDLSASVVPGGQIDILVEMRAPKNPGTYTTTWKIKIGKTEFCPMKLKIIVQ